MDALQKSISRISYYHGSKMCHKGLGFEGTDNIDDFTNYYYTVNVEDEIDKIVAILEKMAERSIRDNNACLLKNISEVLHDEWNNFDERENPDDKSCTLQHFQTKDDKADSELRTVTRMLGQDIQPNSYARALEGWLCEMDHS